MPANTAGLSDDERRAAAFWSKKHGKTKEQTMKEKTDKFFRDEVRIGPNGERIVTKRLVEMGWPMRKATAPTEDHPKRIVWGDHLATGVS